MSALFRAEIASLQRLVEQHHLEQLSALQREARAKGALGRTAANLIAKRQAEATKERIREYVVSQPCAVSANKVAEALGIKKSDTALKHLRALADIGKIQEIPISHLRSKFWKKGKK